MVSNEVGSDKTTLAITVLNPPTAGFKANTNTISGNEAIKFTNQSTGKITSYSWDFGDGTTSKEQNPSHTYPEKGKYTVSLVVLNEAGSDNTTLAISVLEPPIASFSASETKVTSGSSIQFTDESSGDIDSWSWDFGDGTTSAEPNPSHIYEDRGTYTVSLTVSNSLSSDTQVMEDYVNVTNLAISLFEVCSEVTDEGDYTIQPDATFHAGDNACIYFEVTGFENEEDFVGYRIKVLWEKIEIYGPDGELMWSELNVNEINVVSRYLSTYVSFWYCFGKADSSDPLGEYRVEVEVKDELSGETTTKSITFFLRDEAEGGGT